MQAEWLLSVFFLVNDWIIVAEKDAVICLQLAEINTVTDTNNT